MSGVLREWDGIQWVDRVAGEVAMTTTATVGAELGTLIAWPHTVVPDSCVIADGREISRTTYADLFALIGTEHGIGDGSTTFNVPQASEGATLVGYGTLEENGGMFNAIGKHGGERLHQLTIDELPSHNHRVLNGGGTMAVTGTSAADGGVANRQHLASGTPGLVTESVGSDWDHNNMPPFLVVYWIIKALKTSFSAVLTDEVNAAAASASTAIAAAEAVAGVTYIQAGRAGEIIAFGGTVAPSGFVLCDGAIYERSLYPALFAVIGTTYQGASNPTGTQFRVPQLQDRVPVGLGTSTGTNALGAYGGEATHALSTDEMPAHSHAPLVTGAAAVGGTASTTVAAGGSFYSLSGNIGNITIDNTGGGSAHNNLQPFTVVNYIIRTSTAFVNEQVGLAQAAARTATTAVAAITATPIYAASDVTAQAAVVAAHTPSVGMPLFVFRGDRSPDNALQYTVDALTWRRVVTTLAAFDWAIPALVTSWANYIAGFAPYGVFKTAMGVVKFKGLVKSGTGILLTTNPAGYAPPLKTMFPTADGNARTGRIDVFGDNNVAFGSNYTPGYESLANVMYTLDASLTWTNVTFKNSWANYGSGWQTVQYAKDSYGRVWIRGLGAGPATADMAAVFTLPSGFWPNLQLHLTGTSGDGQGIIRVNGAGDFLWMTSNVSTTYCSFEMMFVEVGAAVSWTTLTFQNSWVQYPGFSPATFTKFPDGMVKVKGLITNGTVTPGTVIATLPVGYRPSSSLIFAVAAANAVGRIDINGDGTIVAMNYISNNWTSLDSISFFAEN